MGQLHGNCCLVLIIAISGYVLQYVDMTSHGKLEGGGSSNDIYDDLSDSSRNPDTINNMLRFPNILPDIDISLHITIVKKGSRNTSPRLTPIQYLNIIASQLSTDLTKRTGSTNYYDDNNTNKKSIGKRFYVDIKSIRQTSNKNINLEQSSRGNSTRGWSLILQRVTPFCPIQRKPTCELMFLPSENVMFNTSMQSMAPRLHSRLVQFNQSSNSTWYPGNLSLTLCNIGEKSFLFSANNGDKLTAHHDLLKYKEYIASLLVQSPTFKIGYCRNGSNMTSDDYCYSTEIANSESLCGIFQMCNLNNNRSTANSSCDRKHPQHPIKLTILGLKHNGTGLNCSLALYQVNHKKSSHYITIPCNNITHVLIPRDVHVMECNKEPDEYNCSVWLEVGALNGTYSRGLVYINTIQNNGSLLLSNFTTSPLATTNGTVNSTMISSPPNTTIGITPSQTQYITPPATESVTTGMTLPTGTPISTAVEETTTPANNSSPPPFDVSSIMPNASNIPQVCNLNMTHFLPICEVVLSPRINGSRMKALQNISFRLLSRLGDFNRSLTNPWQTQNMHLQLCKIGNNSFLFRSFITSQPGSRTAMLKFNEYIVMLLLQSKTFRVKTCRTDSISQNASYPYCYSMDRHEPGGGICGGFQKCFSKIDNSTVICDRTHAHHPIQVTLVYLSRKADDCALSLYELDQECPPSEVLLNCSSIVRVINPRVVRDLGCIHDAYRYNCSVRLESGELDMVLRSSWFTDQSNETAMPNVSVSTEPSVPAIHTTNTTTHTPTTPVHNYTQFHPTNATIPNTVSIPMETISSPMQIRTSPETTSSLDTIEATPTPTDEPFYTCLPNSTGTSCEISIHQSETTLDVVSSDGASSTSELTSLPQTIPDHGITFPGVVVPSPSPVNDWSRRPVNQSKIGDLLVDVPLDLKISIPPQLYQAATLREQVTIEKTVLSLLTESLADLRQLGLINISITEIGYGASTVKYNLTMLALSMVEYSSMMVVAIPERLARFPSLVLPSERGTFSITHDIQQFNKSFEATVSRAKHLINESCVLHQACPDGFGCQLGLMCVHICFNFTCGGNGSCVLNNNFRPECRCVESADVVFSGDRCERQTFKYVLEPWKIAVISSAVTTCVIAPILLAVFYIFSRRRNGEVDVTATEAAVSDTGGSVRSRVNSIDDILMDNDESRYEAPPLVTVPIFEANGDSASYLSCDYYRSDSYRAGETGSYSYIGEQRPRLGAYAYQPATRRQFSLHREPSPSDGNTYLDPAVRRENAFIRELMRGISSSECEISAEQSNLSRNDDTGVDDIYSSIRR